MPRRVRNADDAQVTGDGTPADAAELLRPDLAARSTGRGAADDGPAVPDSDSMLEVHGAAAAALRNLERPQPSGRVRHDGKITVYLSTEELVVLEQIRLLLRADYQLAVDRGRIVRAAIASAIEDLLERGGDADLLRKLSGT